MKFKFEKKMYRPITVISSDVIIRGEVEGECDMRYDGRLKGDIRVDGLLLVGKTATITGNLVAGSISIAGKVTGNAYATEKVEITSTGELHGDIKSKTLVIEEGGVYKGKVEDGTVPVSKEGVEKPAVDGSTEEPGVSGAEETSGETKTEEPGDQERR